MERNDLCAPSFAAAKRVISFVLAVALLLMPLSGGMFAPVKAYAADITWDASLKTKLTIPASSTNDYILTGTWDDTASAEVPHNNVNQAGLGLVNIESGYTGTITIRNLTLKTQKDTPTIILYGNGNNNNPNTTVNLIIEGTNTVHTGYGHTRKGNGTSYYSYYAGITVCSGVSLTIDGTGTLTVSAKHSGSNDGNGGGAGIGGGGGSMNYTGILQGGNIHIKGGTITAYGAMHAAGIGGGISAYHGTVIVSGGNLNCVGGEHGAGIGGGCKNTSAGGAQPNTVFGDGIVTVFPPANVTASGGQNGTKYIVGNVGDAVYIGDPKSPQLKVRTATNEKNATIYCDLSSVTTIKNAYDKMGLNTNHLHGVKFGKTGGDGYYVTNAILNKPTTFYTDASSTQPASFGKPFKPAQGETKSNTNPEVVLPLSTLNISLDYTEPTALLQGYTPADAKANAATLVIEYKDTPTLSNVSLAVTDGTNFKNLELYAANGSTPLFSFPATLKNGDKFVVRLPLADGKSLGAYKDFIKLTYDYYDDIAQQNITQPHTQPVEQKVALQDTTYQYIRVTANPVSFISNLNQPKVAVLSLHINHSALSAQPYNKDDVEAYYIISQEKNYNDISPTDAGWKPLYVPDADNETKTSSAIFPTDTAAGTYYIHWKVTSGLIMANSQDFPASGTALPYGAFGQYIVDKTEPELVISGPSTAQMGPFSVFFTFNKENITGFTTNDIILTKGSLVSGPTLVSGEAGITIYTATIKPDALPSDSVTIGVKKKTGGNIPDIGAQDSAGNKVTKTVGDLVVAFTNTVGYTLNKSGDFAYAYGTTTVPDVTMTVKNTGSAILIPQGTVVTLSGADADKFIAVQPTGNIGLSDSKTFALSVKNPATINVGTYSADVEVQYQMGGVEKIPVTLTVTKAKPKPGQGGKVTTNPLPKITPINTTGVTLTPDAGANNTIVSWKYRICEDGKPLPSTWTTVTGSAAATDTFPSTGTYTIEWVIENSNYQDTSGSITPFHIDLVRPKIVPQSTVAPSAAGAGSFAVELTFDKDIANISTAASSWLEGLTNCTASVSRKGTSDRTIVITVQPSSGLADGAKVGFKLKENVAEDSATNGNEGYSFSLNYNSSSPSVISHSFPVFYTETLYNAVETGSFEFRLSSNASGSNKALFASADTELSSANIASFIEINKDSAALSSSEYTVSYIPGADAGTIKVVPKTGFGEGSYTITVKAGIQNKEGNAMTSAYSQSFEVRIPTPSGSSAFTVTPANLPYTGGSVTVKITGKNLQYAEAGKIKFEVKNPGASSFIQLAVTPAVVLDSDGTSATYTYTLPLNTANTSKSYTYKASVNGVSVGTEKTCVVAAAKPDWSGTDHGIQASPTSFATYVGGNVTLTVKGANLHNYTNLKIHVMDSGSPVANIPIPASDLQTSGESTVTKTYAVPNNMTNASKTYNFVLHDGSDNLSASDAGSKGQATVTIAPATPQITSFKGTIGENTDTSLETDEMGGTLVLELNGVHLHNFNPLAVTVKRGGATLSTLSKTALPGATTENYTYELPENTTQSDQLYEFIITKGGSTHSVSVTVKTAAIDLDSNGYGLSVSPNQFDFMGGTADLVVKGRNLYHYSDLKIKVEKDGSSFSEIPLSTTAHGEVTLPRSLVCARNDGTVPVIYTFTLYDGTDSLNKTATVQVEPSVPHIAGFTVSDSAGSLGGDSLNLADTGGTIYFTIAGLHLHNFGNMKIEGDPAAGAINYSGLASNNDKATATATLPANRTMTDQVYVYTLEDADGEQRKVTITVGKPEVGPIGVTANPAKLGASGGSSTIKITGKNMEIALLELTAKDGSGTVHTIPTPGTNVTQGEVSLSFPGHTGGLRNDIYEYEVYFNGEATGLTAEVEVGDSIPSLTGIDATPAYFDSVQNTLGGNGRSNITIKGNYLYNFSELKLYDPIYNRYYTVPNAGKDREASYTISVPSALGEYRYPLYCDGNLTSYEAVIRVGNAAAVIPGGNVDEVVELPNTNKYWSRRGGGSKGGGFTGRLYVPFDVLLYQSQVAATENPNDASVALQNIDYLTSHHFDLAWSGGKKGALESKELGDGIVTLKLDTTTHENNQVLEGRLFVRVDGPLPFIYPGIYLHEVETGETEKRFREKFDNQNLTVICLDQDGEYGTTVEVAAAANLEGFDKSQLYFYRYNRETGEVTHMKNTEHFIDTEKFLHFKTAEGGDVVVTDKPLQTSEKQLESGSFPFEAKKEKVTAKDSEGGKEE